MNVIRMTILSIALLLCACGGSGGSVGSAPAPTGGPEWELGDDGITYWVGEWPRCPAFITHEVPAYADIRDPNSRYVWTWTAFYDRECNIIRIVQ